MCTPAPSIAGKAFGTLQDMMAEGRARSAAMKTNEFMSPRGDRGITQQAQELPPGKYFGNNSSPAAKGMVALAMAKGMQNGYQTPTTINMNNSSNKTGRVIS
jgi:hypothetical protein